jgi:DNA-binding LacI/PurR family transcriptional regulator
VAAVETMMHLIQGEKAVSRRLPAELVLRQSTAAPSEKAKG